MMTAAPASGPTATATALFSLDSGVATGPDDLLPRLLFEYCPRTEVVPALEGYARAATSCSLEAVTG
jgi:hypothetical protein